MLRVEYLIDQVRKLSNNTRYDSNSGVGQDIMALYLNNAQDEIQKALVNTKSKYLLKSTTVPIVNNQQEYDYPVDLYLNNIDTMQWTQDNQSYVNMYHGYMKDRTYTGNGYSYGYVTKNESFVLVPPIDTGTLAIHYIRQLPRMATRSGLISAVTVNSGVVTALSVNTSDASYNASEIATDNYLCVVDYLGNIKATAIQYSAMSSGVFTLPAHTLLTGESVAVGDYIVVGKYATNKPELPEITQGFLIKYANYQAKYGDSSQWSKVVQDDMTQTLIGLTQSFGMNSDDVGEIPITNFDYLQLF